MSDVLVQFPATRMWTLSNDQETVCLQIPPVSVAGIPQALQISLDLDAEMVDEIINRLTLLRSQMLPGPIRH